MYGCFVIIFCVRNQRYNEIVIKIFENGIFSFCIWTFYGIINQIQIMEMDSDNSVSLRIFNIKCAHNDVILICEKISIEFPDINIKISSENDESPYKVELSGNDNDDLNKAEAMFRSSLPINGFVFGLDPNSQNSIDLVYRYANDHTYVSESIRTIENCFNTFKSDNVCISFNGGKDCTALLHIVHAVYTKKFVCDNKLKALHIKMPESFPLLDSFVQQSVKRYHLQMLTYNGPDYKSSLENLKRETTIEAIFMGTRSSDSSICSKMTEFQETDNGWPKFVRVNPLLNWTYTQVWSFLRDLNVSYCSLYDHGYTSLGSPNNTRQNPLLEFHTRNGEICYLPAYMLQDPDKERTSRTQ